MQIADIKKSYVLIFHYVYHDWKTSNISKRVQYTVVTRNANRNNSSIAPIYNKSNVILTSSIKNANNTKYSSMITVIFILYHQIAIQLSTPIQSRKRYKNSSKIVKGNNTQKKLKNKKYLILVSDQFLHFYVCQKNKKIWKYPKQCHFLASTNSSSCYYLLEDRLRQAERFRICRLSVLNKRHCFDYF